MYLPLDHCTGSGNTGRAPLIIELDRYLLGGAQHSAESLLFMFMNIIA